MIDFGLHLLSNPELKGKVEEGTFIFVESHCCLNDSKYVTYDIFNNPTLTPYARHHMDECCIVFDITANVKVGNQKLALTMVLNRDVDSDIKFAISFPKDKNFTVQE